MIIFYKKSPTLIIIILLFIFSLNIFIFSILLNNYSSSIIIEWPLIIINASIVNLPVFFDPQGLLFSSAVCFISGNVIIFSNLYISTEKFISRFIHLVLLFIISINLLIFIPNIIFILLGWDGLGLISFLLVIYYHNNSSLAAGLITAFTNRIGDVLILLRISLIIYQGQWSLLTTLHNPSRLVIFLIIVAAITKSAQIPFRRWLPAAIAAPTPVSALVHSSTLVTAGVFLIYRFYPVINIYKLFNPILFIIGSITIFIAGTAAIVETDIKKIIALSTLSQLGVIISTLGLGLPKLAFFHLITHALFKALLFICAGTLINFHNHSQELRGIGNIITQIPLINISLFSANLALCGAPFMAGFYSKDLIIETILFSFPNIIIYLIFILATTLTAAYSSRFTILVIISEPISSSVNPLNDSSLWLTSATLILSLGAISIGSLISWFFIYPILEPILMFKDKIFAMASTFLGIILGWKIAKKSFVPWALSFKLFSFIFSSIWIIKNISTQLIINPPISFAKKSLSIIDQGWYEIYGPQILINSLYIYSSTILSINKISLITLIAMSLIAPFWLIF